MSASWVPPKIARLRQVAAAALAQEDIPFQTVAAARYGQHFLEEAGPSYPPRSHPRGPEAALGDFVTNGAGPPHSACRHLLRDLNQLADPDVSQPRQDLSTGSGPGPTFTGRAMSEGVCRVRGLHLNSSASGSLESLLQQEWMRSIVRICSRSWTRPLRSGTPSVGQPRVVSGADVAVRRAVAYEVRSLAISATLVYQVSLPHLRPPLSFRLADFEEEITADQALARSCPGRPKEPRASTKRQHAQELAWLYIHATP